MADAGKSLGLSEIGQIAVTVQDLEGAVEFYRDVLGMRLLLEAPGMAFFKCGSVRLMLGTSEAAVDESGGTIIYYRVPDIQRAYSALRERGAEFIREPAVVHRAEGSELWMAFFSDSEGNTAALMSEVPVTLI
ncbi:MAG: VOC family protein [Gemmatimonadota bacterium]|nr:MAG: VOC family protein [Gemmatimonadota bacterium]